MGLLYEAVMKRNFIITQLEKANITDYQNKSIYQLDYQTLNRAYGVYHSTIERIVKNKSWKHVGGM
ncbi:hypothetical protein MXL46_08375 [Heyndrickxia sporothermodurans]|uniref:hypothetical protein n=1 Tax=Heyndrickxia sporothermodurans TaxID=46224 RepID=UPI002DBC1E0C|nr:hypothetical protein [Heyndrickxia sporothermodurans]MEB6549111.1 hypothetical protein [Heyndrickxia sporothermodurans]